MPSSFLAGRLTVYRCISQQVRSQIQEAIGSTPVVLFMKGTQDAPQCGFSRAAVQVLGIQGVPAEKPRCTCRETSDIQRTCRRGTATGHQGVFVRLELTYFVVSLMPLSIQRVANHSSNLCKR